MTQTQNDNRAIADSNETDKRENDEYDSDAIDSGGDDSSDVILALICDSDEEDASEGPNATRSRRTSWLFYKHGRGVELGSTVKQLQLVVRAGLQVQRPNHWTTLPPVQERCARNSHQALRPCLPALFASR